MMKFEFGRTVQVLVVLFMTGVAILSAFGVSHASESILIAVISPILLVFSVTIAVAVIVVPFTKEESNGDQTV